MIRALFLLCGLLLAQASRAQFAPFVQGPKAAAGAYTGPGDVKPGAAAWYGLRAYSAATRGAKLINVCNLSDVVCVDMSSDASTGLLVITSVGGSSCSVILCTIKTWYDATGNGNDVSMATIANRPTLTVSYSFFTSRPVLQAASQWLALNTFTAITGNFTAAGISADPTAGFQWLFSITTGPDVDILYNSSCSFLLRSGGSNLFAPDGTGCTAGQPSAFEAIYNGTTATVNGNGTSTSGSVGAPTASAYLSLFATGTGGAGAGNTILAEIGFWNSVFSSGDQTAMTANMRGWGGF